MTVATLQDKGLWDDLVDKSRRGLIFHKWDFLKIVEKHSGYRLLPLGIYKGDSLTCVFPLFCKRELGMKMVFSPPPHACIPYMGPVMGPMYDELKQKRKESYLGTAIDEVNAEIRKISPNYTSIINSPGISDIRPYKWNGYRDESQYTYLIDITASIDDIWAGFDSTCKKNIKKGEKLGLSLKQVHDPVKFYGVMTKRYSEQGLRSPLYSSQYLADLLEAYPDNVKMFFVYLGDEIAALCIDCDYKDRVIHWLGAAKLDNGFSGNDFMVWELINKAKADGFMEFEIQGANQKRLSEFKSKFNPRLETYYPIQKSDSFGRLAEWAYVNIKMKKTLSF